MKFLTTGEKLRNLRHQLNIEQDALTQIGVSRNFISMLENNKRELTESRAMQITELLRKIAEEKDMDFNIADDYLFITPCEEAERYCCTALDNLKSLAEASAIYEVINTYNLNSIRPRYYLAIADMLFEEKNYSKAFINYLDSLHSYMDIKEHIKMPYIYNRLGRCRSLNLDYMEALFYFIKSYEASLLYGDEKTKKVVLYNIAWCNININNIDSALHYINRYLELCNKNETFDDYIRGTILKADYYVRIQEFELAEKIYNKSIKLFADEYNPLLGYIYNNLGDIYVKINSTSLALECFDKAQSIIEKADIARLSHTLIHKANLFISTNDYSEALLQTVQAIAYAKSFKDTEYLYKGYVLLETIYEHFNNNEKLKQVYKDMLNLLDDTSDANAKMKIHAKLSIISIKDNKLDTCLTYLKNIVNM
ncbi:helix-turn-helix transcriptional regulator [Clostridium tunisiense]|uniref:helix-turn-helix transcriptional regulator n=1 Tax=Clostridium tunisiense TaxID=219748 RepID=UPI000300FA31|nr:helix-turn-helix transcriptional regulator [Clostridium tunisiense]